MLLQKLLPHPSEAADITGRLGKECEVRIVIVAVFCVSDLHNYFLLYDLMNSAMGSCAASSRPVIIPAIIGTTISSTPIVNS